MYCFVGVSPVQGNKIPVDSCYSLSCYNSYSECPYLLRSDSYALFLLYISYAVWRSRIDAQRNYKKVGIYTKKRCLHAALLFYP